MQQSHYSQPQPRFGFQAFIAEAAPSSSGRCSACNASKQRRTKRGALKKWAKRSKYLVPDVSSWFVIVSVSNYCSWCSAYSKRTNWFRPSTEKKASAVISGPWRLLYLSVFHMWLKYVKFVYDLRRTNHQTLTILTNQIIIHRNGAQILTDSKSWNSCIQILPSTWSGHSPQIVCTKLPKTYSPWSFSNHSNQNAKQTEGGFANSNCPISSCQLSVFSPRASPDCTSHRWSAFSPTFHSSKVSFTTDPTDFWEWQIWVVAFSSRFTIWQSQNSITSHLLQKISHMILQGVGPMIFLKMLQTKRLQSTVVDVRERNSQTTPL